jgi:hypothetical protein
MAVKSPESAKYIEEFLLWGQKFLTTHASKHLQMYGMFYLGLWFSNFFQSIRKKKPFFFKAKKKPLSQP